MLTVSRRVESDSASAAAKVASPHWVGGYVLSIPYVVIGILPSARIAQCGGSSTLMAAEVDA
jgi:hypothetical protein